MFSFDEYKNAIYEAVEQALKVPIDIPQYNKYGSVREYDAYIDSDNVQDRYSAAKLGYGLEMLKNDENDVIRAMVAYKGVGIDEMLYDSNALVQSGIQHALVYNEKARQDFLHTADDVSRQRAMSLISSYKQYTERGRSLVLDNFKSRIDYGSYTKLQRLYEQKDKLLSEQGETAKKLRNMRKSTTRLLKRQCLTEYSM